MQVSAPLLLQLGAVLTVLALLGTVARRFALSPIPVYLLTGLALGNGGLAPVVTAGQFITTGAPIGIVLLLLTLGLEFSATEFASSLRHHLPSAAVDVVLNATPGALAGWLLGLNGVGVLALAGVTYVSSSGVIARLLEDLHRLGNRETPAVLAVLVLEDFAMAAYLPLVAVLGAGRSWLVAMGGMAAAVAALCVAFAASYRWGHHFGRLVTHPDSEQLLLRVLGITLIVAALAEKMHASAAVGAFLVGLTLTGETADRARKAAGSAARPVRRDLLRRGRAAGGSRAAITDASDSRDTGRSHRGDEGGHRNVRRPPRRSGAARAAARRHDADSQGRVLADHHRPARLVNGGGFRAGDHVCVRVGDRGAGAHPFHRWAGAGQRPQAGIAARLRLVSRCAARLPAIARQ